MIDFSPWVSTLCVCKRQKKNRCRECLHSIFHFIGEVFLSRFQKDILLIEDGEGERGKKPQGIDFLVFL